MEVVSKERETALLMVKKIEDKSNDLAHALDTHDKIIEKGNVDLEAKNHELAKYKA